MNTSDYTTTIAVDQSPEETFNAINNVSGWWSSDFEGHSERLNDTFIVRFGETWITSKVVELVPGRKIVWQVTDCNKHWLKNKKEWVDTIISWEISKKDDKTQMHFTHFGLVPQLQCYDACENAWGEYINGSLRKLLVKGKGQPS
jgi:hypothetical protein